jgi:hypothetical protein
MNCLKMSNTMKFYQEEEGTWSAIRENVIENGWHYSELYFADILKVYTGGFTVRWNDRYQEQHNFNEIGDAKQYIVLEYHKHKPHENGVKYKIDEE